MLEIIQVIFHFLKCYQKNNPLKSCIITILFSLIFLSLIQFETRETTDIVDKNMDSILQISRGGDKNVPESNNFLPPGSSRSGTNDFRSDASSPSSNDMGPDISTNRGSNNHNSNFKRYPWAISGSSNGGNSGASNNDPLSKNSIPDKNEWVDSPKYWHDKQEESKKRKQSKELSYHTDFPFAYDKKGKPTLFVPNTGDMRKKRPYTKVTYDQTLTHIHHAPDLNIELPESFNMDFYKSLESEGRIRYAEQQLSSEIIGNYQNEIGKSMSSFFDKKVQQVPDFAGKRKRETALTIQTIKPNVHILSIIREDGTHISSYSVTDNQLRTLAKKGNFWVLRNQDI